MMDPTDGKIIISMLRVVNVAKFRLGPCNGLFLCACVFLLLVSRLQWAVNGTNSSFRAPTEKRNFSTEQTTYLHRAFFLSC